MAQRNVGQTVVDRAVNGRGETALLVNGWLHFGDAHYMLERIAGGTMPAGYREEDVFRFEDSQPSPETYEDSRMIVRRGETGVEHVVFYTQVGEKPALPIVYRAILFGEVAEKKNGEADETD